MFEGSMRVLDMILTDIDRAGDKASIIRTKSDVPTKPNVGKVQYFLDIEGGGAIQTDLPEPGFSHERFGAAEAGAFPTLAQALARRYPVQERGRVNGFRSRSAPTHSAWWCTAWTRWTPC